MSNSGFPAPSDGQWGTNQEDCVIDLPLLNGKCECYEDCTTGKQESTTIYKRNM